MIDINNAVQTIIQTRDFCGDEREALRDWQSENGIRLTAHQKQQVWEDVEKEWSLCQIQAGVKRPISNQERLHISRVLENA